jgi:hypothetical protein
VPRSFVFFEKGKKMEKESLISATSVVGILSEINGRFAAISAKQFIAPLQQRGPHLVAVGEAGHKIKRLYTLQQMLDQKCEKLTAQKDAEAFAMMVDLCDIVGRLFRNEVLRQFPMFIHKPFVFCNDWTLCWDKCVPMTGDLFRQPERAVVAPKETRRNGNDIQLTAGALHN